MLLNRKVITIIILLSVTVLVGCSGLRYSGTKGGKTKYQDVKTEVVELKITYYSDMQPVSDIFIRNDEGTFFREESFDNNEEQIPVSEELLDKLDKWVDEYNIRFWDGYDMKQKNIMDGGGFRLNIRLATGEVISAHGSNAYPDGYSDANKALNEIIGEALDEINKSSANAIMYKMWGQR